MAHAGRVCPHRPPSRLCGPQLWAARLVTRSREHPLGVGDRETTHSGPCVWKAPRVPGGPWVPRTLTLHNLYA